jgi:hypothetical protein
VIPAEAPASDVTADHDCPPLWVDHSWVAQHPPPEAGTTIHPSDRLANLMEAVDGRLEASGAKAILGAEKLVQEEPPSLVRAIAAHCVPEHG